MTKNYLAGKYKEVNVTHSILFLALQSTALTKHRNSNFFTSNIYLKKSPRDTGKKNIF